MNYFDTDNFKEKVKDIDPILYEFVDEGFDKLKFNLNKEFKSYFLSFRLDKLRILMDDLYDQGLKESSGYFQYVIKALEFIENAAGVYENYDENLEIKTIKEKIRKDKMSFFKKAVIFDGEQRQKVLDKIEEKDKELDYSYEYIAENILTSLWEAGFEERIENVFMNSKIEELSYFDFNQYNNSHIDNKISQIYY